MKLGFVTGMLSEARLLTGLDGMIVSGGGDPVSTAAKVDDLIRGGATHLVSFGIAGALAPELRPGDLVLATAVLMPDGSRIDCDPSWVESAHAKLPQAGLVTALGASAALASAHDKATAYRDTGAAVVDMESHHVALAARHHHLPFIVIRAVADTADDTLPPAALVGLNKEGRPAIGAVLLSLLRNPFQLPALLRVARRSDIALKALLGSRAGLL